MNAQDPELSAALGWPGGISDPVLDRTQLLQMAAALRLASQQALEALTVAWQQNPRWQITESMHALRAALAQQAEPDLSRCPQCNGPADNGFDRSFPPSPYLCTKCMAEPKGEGNLPPPLQAEPAQEPYAWHYTNNAGASVWHRGPSNRLDADMQAARDYPHVHKVTDLYTAPPKNEPAQEPGAWVASKDGRVIYDDASTDDGLLRVSGDFENDEQRVRYAKQIVDKLNAALAQQAEPVEPVAWLYRGNLHPFDPSDWASDPVTPLYAHPPQRKPLTDGEIPAMAKKAWKPSVYYDAVALLGTDGLVALVRAVEKAVWEKNHGKA